MLRELVRIPFEYNGVPIFGGGVLLALWCVGWGVALFVFWRRARAAPEASRFAPLDQVRAFLPLFLVTAGVIYFLPYVFEDGLPIRGYGVMMLLGVVSGVGLAMHLTRRAGLNPEIMLSLVFWMFVAGIIGARLFYVIQYWERFRTRKDGDTVVTLPVRETLVLILKFSEGGLVVYGALILVLIAVVLFVKKHRLPGLAVADLIIPSMALGQGIGRIGCLLNGCCFGGYCDLPWAVRFPPDSPPYVSQMERGLWHGIELEADPEKPPLVVRVDADSPAARAGLAANVVLSRINGVEVRSACEAQALLVRLAAEVGVFEVGTQDGRTFRWVLPNARPPASRDVHPAQIYAAIDALLLAGFLLAYYPFRRRDGEVIALGLTIHPITRFLLEEIRIDEAGIWGTRFSISQIVGAFILVAAVALWVYILRRPAGTAWPTVGVNRRV
jgi:phosphatidylglycerol:prolipoprotein diacylglycerol transferase